MPKISFEPPIYPYHIDAMGHVSNIAFIQWMEVGRCLLLEAVDLPVARALAEGYGPVLIGTDITYRKELNLGDRVRATIWISEMSRATAVTAFDFHNGAGDLVATGKQVGLFIDLKTRKPRRISLEMKTRLLEYLEISEPRPVQPIDE